MRDICYYRTKFHADPGKKFLTGHIAWPKFLILDPPFGTHMGYRRRMLEDTWEMMSDNVQSFTSTGCSADEKFLTG